MFEPIRGGTRGGQAEFKWSDVSADKDREHYLGHSINAPTGRWQKNKDVHWYNRDKDDTEAERLEEIRKIKEAEAEALAAALGFEPTKKTNTNGPTGSNNVPLGATSSTSKPEDAQLTVEKEEKRKRKQEKKEEKRAKKEARRAEKHGGEHDAGERHRRRSSRSRSPRRSGRDEGDNRERRRTRTPTGVSREYTRMNDSGEYDSEARERERDRDRRRWEQNQQRDQPRRRRD